MRLALLTAYRGRPEHLLRQRAWLERLRGEELEDFEWLVVEGDTEPRVREAVDASWARYHFVPMEGPFNKAILLNQAASMARASRLCPLDVDLLPAHGTLTLHCRLAEDAPGMLVTGFRLQLGEMPDVASPRECTPRWIHALGDGDEQTLGPEENLSATRKYLLRGQRFGVCPFYDRRDWQAVRGNDEGFVGWGGEDQDLVERVVALGRTLVRCYDLLYFHMPHGREAGWRDAALTERNRERFRTRAALRRGGPG